MKTTNLTIQEAIQSGLPLKRPTWVNYVKAIELSSCGIGDLDILAKDWQIKVPEVTITREKLAEAWEKVRYAESAEESITFREICKELGV